MSHLANTIWEENLQELQEETDFEHIWKLGKRARQAAKNAKFFTETIPNDLKKLDRTAQAFSKVKLNERGLPW